MSTAAWDCHVATAPMLLIGVTQHALGAGIARTGGALRHRPRDTPIWELEAALKCRSCGTRRYEPPVHLIKQTMEREITPCVWVHPDDNDRQ